MNGPLLDRPYVPTRGNPSSRKPKEKRTDIDKFYLERAETRRKAKAAKRAENIRKAKEGKR